MGKIKYYLYDGTLQEEKKLTDLIIGGTNGMLIKCHMKDGKEIVGYSDLYRVEEGPLVHQRNTFIFQIGLILMKKSIN